ncbi:hypothetical protein V6U84_03590 [Micromonospora sp. CPCC 205714]
MPEVLEALNAGCDDDEDVGVLAGGGGERVRETGRHDDQVAAFSGDHLVAGEQLRGAVQQVEGLAVDLPFASQDAPVDPPEPSAAPGPGSDDPGPGRISIQSNAAANMPGW